jgi:hypothetical protein
VIAGWLIFRDREDLGIDTLGVVVLIVTPSSWRSWRWRSSGSPSPPDSAAGGRQQNRHG